MYTGVPLYDPTVIERFAERLYEKARSFVVGSVVVGAALGAAFGAIPLTPIGESWPIPAIFGFATLLVGGIIGGMCGYVIGDTRAFGYRLQAQTALLQLQIERNTFAAAQVGGRPAPSREASPRPAAAPPQAPPASVRPPAPAPAPPASVRPPAVAPR
jgi:hypothetical protein